MELPRQSTLPLMMEFQVDQDSESLTTLVVTSLKAQELAQRTTSLQTFLEDQLNSMLTFPAWNADASQPSTLLACQLRTAVETIPQERMVSTTVMPTKLVELTAQSLISWRPTSMPCKLLHTHVTPQQTRVTITTVTDQDPAGRTPRISSAGHTDQEAKLIPPETSTTRSISMRVVELSLTSLSL